MAAPLDWPFVSDVEWTHGTTLGVEGTVQLLTRTGLRIHFSSPLHPTIVSPPPRQRQPQVVEVYFEPDSPELVTAAIFTPQPILVVHGTVKFSAEDLTWQSSDNPDSLKAIFSRAAGRLQIRLHAGHLVDRNGRPFSSAVDALTGFTSPRVPGGTWESWIFTGTF